MAPTSTSIVPHRCCSFLPLPPWPRRGRGELTVRMHSRGHHVTCPVWIYVPSLPPWHGGWGWGAPHGQNCAEALGPQSPPRALSLPKLPPRGGPAARPGLSCPSRATHAAAVSGHRFSRPPSRQLGFPASSLFWARHGQICGDEPTRQPVGNVGVEQASRNERPAGRGEGCQGGSLITGLSVLISHGAWARTSLRPFTQHWGPDTRGPPL